MAERTFEGFVPSISDLRCDCTVRFRTISSRRLLAGNIGQPISGQVVAERKYDQNPQPQERRQ